jgi:hypothetical protein
MRGEQLQKKRLLIFISKTKEIVKEMKGYSRDD